MSTGKRLAKRSILGTRIVAPGHDGRFYPAIIQAVKTLNELSDTVYSCRFDNSRKVSEFLMQTFPDQKSKKLQDFGNLALAKFSVVPWDIF